MGRGEQQVFWGTHGDVGGGYRDTELHSEHVLWWMTRKLRQVISYAPRLGAECTICTEENSHWPHPLSKYIGNFGWSRGREYRPSTEHPMPGTLALAFFYDDMNFSNVGLDRDTALATQADFPTYYLHYTVGVSGAVGAYPWGYHAATVYAIYHYYAFYSSLIHYFVNRVDE